MNSQTDQHLANLRSIVHAPLDVEESGQFHRFYWMSDSQSPHILVDENHSLKKLRTDYGVSCHDVGKYWKKVSPSARSTSSCRASSMYSVVSPLATWESFCKRDTVSKILNDPMARIPPSLYRDSFTGNGSTDYRGYHIRSNPISKFGEALFIQKNVIR